MGNLDTIDKAIAVPESVTTGTAISIIGLWDKWLEIPSDTVDDFLGTVRFEVRRSGGDWYLLLEQTDSPSEVVRVEIPHPTDVEIRANTTAYTSGSMTPVVSGRR